MCVCVCVFVWWGWSVLDQYTDMIKVLLQEDPFSWMENASGLGRGQQEWCEQEGQIPVMQVSMVAWITVLRVDTKKREKTWERVTGCLDVGRQWKGGFWFEPSNWWDDPFLRRSREQEAGRRIEDVRKLWAIYIWDIRENEFWIWKGGSQRS